MFARLVAPPRPLVVAFAVLVMGFVASTLSAEWSDVIIRRDADSITTNSAESVYRISAMRSVLRRFEVMVDDYVDHPSEEARSEIANLRSDLTTTWQEYQRLPSYPGERQLWSDVESSLQRVDLLLALIFTGHPADSLAVLEGQLKPEVDALDVGLAHIDRLNREAGVDLVRRIDHTGRRSVVLAAVLDGSCAVLAVLFVVLLVRAENRYRRVAEIRNAELELFASRVAHDILSPLNAVSMFVDIVGRNAQLDQPTARLHSLARGSMERTSALVNDLLDFARAGARPEQGAHAEVDKVIHDVSEELGPLAEQAHIELRIEPSPKEVVACSRGVLMSIVSNLARNAIKYMGDASERWVAIRVADGAQRVRIEVQDSGPGVPPDLAPQLFQPHVRRARSGIAGIGLGLATVKRLAESHGGRAGVIVPVHGALFWVELPRA
jgi:signal transduction histidine kinase